MQQIFESGYYNDNGEREYPELLPKPGLCILCKKDGNEDEEVLCNLNRLDQADSNKEFVCGSFVKMAN